MMNCSSFIKKWNEMPARSNGYLSLELDHQIDFQIGYHSDKSKSLVIMNSGEISDLPSSRIVEVNNIEICRNEHALEFHLTDNSYEEIFLKLCWDLIDSSRDAECPIKIWKNRYIRWLKFLEKMSNRVMSFQEQKGLLGELLYLEECIKERGVYNAIDAWLGPDGSDQDFVFSEGWTEVKAISLAAEKVTISSMQQLDQESKGFLRVYFLEKTNHGKDRVSLNEQVKKIRNHLENEDRYLDRFEMKLFKYGFRDSDSHEYAKLAFRNAEKRTYMVDECFPKIVRANVPIEVVSCSYSLSLIGIEEYRVNSNEDK